MSTVRDPESGYGFVDKSINAWRIRKSGYQQVFGGEGAAKNVLNDLAIFCRANQSTFTNDTHRSAYLQGRQDVWLHIQERLNLSSEELFSLSQVRKK